ncbi:hypothetical protein EVAR_77461_1 [Eumeta japonica]|uniref:Uncharacterized protein n=1 Tax=Eumeta variegata TaxID=151549 RepID=A0A4C1ZXA1_EUMVA|nr:hypothetical protein EVAR_77461_1 [Eumeta japonica]
MRVRCELDRCRNSQLVAELRSPRGLFARLPPAPERRAVLLQVSQIHASLILGGGIVSYLFAANFQIQHQTLQSDHGQSAYQDNTDWSKHDHTLPRQAIPHVSGTRPGSRSISGCSGSGRRKPKLHDTTKGKLLDSSG